MYEAAFATCYMEHVRLGERQMARPDSELTNVKYVVLDCFSKTFEQYIYIYIMFILYEYTQRATTLRVRPSLP
jgi:hypothetical protein